MPQPTSAVNRLDLGLRVSEFDTAADRLGFIGSKVFPILTRDKDHGDFPKFKEEQLLQTRDTNRGPGGDYPRSEGEWDMDTFQTAGKGHEAPVDETTAAKYGDIVDAEMYESERITDIVLRGFEIAAAAAAFNATTWSGKTTNLSTPWSTHASATPRDDINTARESIFDNCAMEPNALVLSRPAFRDLTYCDDIIDNLKSQNFVDVRAGAISQAQMAVALDLDRIIVCGAGKNTANPAQTRSNARIWDKTKGLLAKIAVTDNPAEPCIGRTIIWSDEGVMDGDDLGVILESYYEDRNRTNWFRARTDYVIKMLYTSMGWMLTNVTA